MHTNYWQRAYRLGRQVYQDRKLANVDEQAGPAYFAALSLSRWLFWRRLKWAAKQISRYPGQTAIDFGCGFGLLLPHLQAHYQSIFAVDQVTDLAIDFVNRWPQADQSSGKVTFARSLEQTELQPQSVDLIVALDVLEHFENLQDITLQLAGLLKPNGRLLVSGPTESWLYQLGRKLVGFSGEYHHQTIYQVHTALEQHFHKTSQAWLPPVMPLFVMSTWTT